MDHYVELFEQAYFFLTEQCNRVSLK